MKIKMANTEDLSEALRVLSRKHALDVFNYIAENRVASSSEIVIGSGIQPVQTYRVLTELEKEGFIKREMKVEKITKPHVFWELTTKGMSAKDCIDDFQKKLK